jgi:hypothetical protein
LNDYFCIMKINQLLVFLIFPLQTFAQLDENFSDGDFSMNPEWVGDTSSFTVNAGRQLQSQGAAVTETIFLSAANSRLSDTEWKFFARLEFNPSSGNYAKYYLSADTSELTGSVNGYYVKIGGVTGNVDAIDLYRQEGISSLKIISGKAGHAGKNINTLNIRVIRDISGKWTLYSDTLGGNDFSLEGSCIDSTLKTSKYTGLACHHSSTRGTKFFFDDIVIRQAPVFPYKVIIELDSVINIFFNKPLESSSAGISSNYNLSGTGSPVAAIYNVAYPNQVKLIFAGKINTGNYSLGIQNIKAFSGEIIAPNTNIDFNYIKPIFYGSIVIDEIFADPSPSAGLPGEEYIELYNRSSDTINLSGFSFSDGSTVSTLPSSKFAPGSYLTLCSSSFTSAFSSFGNVLGLSSWPSLNNTGDSLKISDAGGRIIFSVAYSDNWYKNIVKKAGGWSLEMIDPDNLCGEAENWADSENDNGGTPGRVNSINASRPDLDPPVMLKAMVLDSIKIKIYFNESLDTLNYKNALLQISPAITIASSSIEKTDNHSLIITITSALQPKTLYTITIGNMADCSGNTLLSSSVSLTLPEQGAPGDIILNEILFNPRPGSIDFVEIYNRSEKYLDLKNWGIANIANGQVAYRKPLVNESLILPPHEYLFLSEDPALIKSQYPFAQLNNSLTISSMPSYNDDEGSAILLYNNQIADRFDYLDSFHFSLLTDNEGVSLERISFEEPGNSPDQWHSASESSGFATPGYRNSQSYNGSGKGFFVDPPVFTPDEDGYKDFTTIHFSFPEPGYVGNITIFDAQGREIKKLVQNQSLSAEGFFQWDGTGAGGRSLESGYFIILFEIFNLEGDVNKFKETVAIGMK